MKKVPSFRSAISTHAMPACTLSLFYSRFYAWCSIWPREWKKKLSVMGQIDFQQTTKTMWMWALWMIYWQFWFPLSISGVIRSTKFLSFAHIRLHFNFMLRRKDHQCFIHSETTIWILWFNKKNKSQIIIVYLIKLNKTSNQISRASIRDNQVSLIQLMTSYAKKLKFSKINMSEHSPSFYVCYLELSCGEVDIRHHLSTRMFHL